MRSGEDKHVGTVGTQHDKEKYVIPVGVIVRYVAFAKRTLGHAHAPHWSIALLTLLLVIFAFFAWRESVKTTMIFQEQLSALRTDQRPLMWVNAIDAAPVYNESNGQVNWSWAYDNIGKEIAYNMVEIVYIKIGREHYQKGRSSVIENNYIELEPSKPLDVPPHSPERAYGTVFSRPGIDKTYYQTMLNTNAGFGIMVKFTYTDASGTLRFTNSECIERLANGARAIMPPEDCEKE